MNSIKLRLGLILFLPFPLCMSNVQAETFQDYLHSARNGISQLFVPKPANDSNRVSLQKLSNFQLDTSSVQETLPTVGIPKSGRNRLTELSGIGGYEVGLVEAIQQALQRRPEITQSIASIAGQAANIDVAKAQYYPQISGGVSTADLNSSERGQQLLTLSATQMLYDFGKIKGSVHIEEAKLLQEQAKTLINIDDIAFQTANAIVNIKRYQEIVKIADQQIEGISRIAEIANLRAKAGISSQADPVQAQSDLEAAKSNKIIQETQLRQYQQKLRTLLGYEVSNVQFQLPDDLVRNAALYTEPDLVQIPDMMAAQAGIQIAKFQKEQIKSSVYPTINVKASLSQALNGRNPNNNKDDGFYNSIMLEASSNFFQGGAVSSRQRSASYSEEAAKAQANTTYLNVLDQVRLIREEIENKQRQIQILTARRETTVRTRELYQEQYKLGTRTVVDLLNSEQAIHSAAQEIETAKYDIYAGLVKYIQVTGRSRELYHLNNTVIQGFEIQP